MFDSSTIQAPNMPKSAAPLWVAVPVAAALTLLVVAVFYPILGFGFIDYDVDGQVVKNPHIRELTGENLTMIFTSRSLTSYYPVRTLTFAIDYQLWGLNPRGFKLTNLIIHLANTWLVFWLILRLTRQPPETSAPSPFGSLGVVGTAGLSAGLFAFHPVVVEPVTWVAGREELLMTLGALGCFHCHLSARRQDTAGDRCWEAWGYRAGSVFFCAMACLSNAVGAVIALLVTAWDLLHFDRLGLRKIIYGTWVLWVIGALTIAVKKLGPTDELLADQAGVFSIQRLMLVLDVFRLNLQTLVWPSDLAILYADSPSRSLLDLGVIVGGLAVGLSGLLLWKLRRHKPLVYGLLWFGLALAPSSQLIPHHWIRADRFLYLPLVGLAVAAAAAMTLLNLEAARKLGRSAEGGILLTAVLVVLLLGRRSAVQVDIWRSNVSLWENSVRISPESAVAHGALADALTKAGDFRRAASHYWTALEIDPDDLGALNNFALELAANDDVHLRDYQLAVELARRGCELTQWQNEKLRRTLAMVLNNSALEAESRGDFRRAVEGYSEAAEADPGYEAPLFNLALLLTTCGDPTLRDADAAVQAAERACQLVRYADPNGLMILAAAYAEAGRPDLAAAAAQMAIDVAVASGNHELALRIHSTWKPDGDRR
jgi:protein O-mannosyl-transferase